MSANTILNAGTGGDVIAADDLGTAKAQRVKLMLGATGVDGGNVTPTNAIPTISSGANVFQGAGNTSSAQLAAGASFSGTPETVFNQAAVSVLVVSDQPVQIILNQWQDAGGTKVVVSQIFTVAANVNFSQSIPASGNYFSLKVTNLGPVATTSLAIDTVYGTLLPATQLNNAPVALAEYAGAAISPSNPVPVQVANTPNVNLATLGADPAYALALIYAELKLITQYLQMGLSVQEDPNNFRTDPSYLQ